MFDSMSNYLFCQECVVKALRVSKQRLARQRTVKWNAFQHLIKKADVESDDLVAFVVMPEGLTTPLNAWWRALPSDHEVDVCFLYDRHGHSGRVLNKTKIQAKADFFAFVDEWETFGFKNYFLLQSQHLREVILTMKKS